MAGGAVLRERLIASRLWPLVVAAEASREVCMPQVVGIRPPSHLQIWENVAVVNRRQYHPRLLNLTTPLIK